MESIRRYFPNLSEEQFKQFDRLKALYQDWNQQINVISRKDLDEFYIRHVLHSMAIYFCIKFAPGSRVLDVGTGGGFPGIPLAILFPETEFVLIDSIGKKIKVVQGVADSLGLKNVTAIHGRAEELNESFDFVVSRAVTQAERFMSWMKGKIKKRSINSLPNGYIFLKGGDLQNEFGKRWKHCQVHSISDLFKEEFFETKKMIYLSA